MHQSVKRSPNKNAAEKSVHIPKFEIRNCIALAGSITTAGTLQQRASYTQTGICIPMARHDRQAASDLAQRAGLLWPARAFFASSITRCSISRGISS
jgi:hypothetical protein